MSLKKLLPYLLILTLSGYILSNNITKPFIGHHDWNSVFYSNISRNYLRYGYLQTRLGQVTNFGYQPDQFNYYTHYPPLFPLALSLFYRLLNISSLTTRAMPAIFTTLSLVLLYHISRKLKFSISACLASGLVLFTPMLRYFGKMPSQEALIVCFTLLSVNYYLDLINKPSRSNKLKFFLATLLNAFSGWAGYFIYPLLAIHSYKYKRQLFSTAAKAIVLLIAVFILHLTHTALLTGSPVGGGLIHALLLRLNLTDYPDFTWPKYLIQQARWLTIYYTRPILAAAAISLGLISLKIFRKIKLSLADSILLALLAWGLSYPIIFSNVVFIHDYFNIFFVPFFSLSLAWLINQLWQKKKSVTIVCSLVLAGLIYFERLPFYQSLEATKAFEPGYKQGTLINQTTAKSQTVQLNVTKEFAQAQGLFTQYYADRDIEFIIED